MKSNNISLRQTALEFNHTVQEESIRILSKYLSYLLNLALITKQAHWNTHGANFIAIHEMLDPFNSNLLSLSDTLAERIVQMGGTAYGTPEMIVLDSPFENYPTDITSTTEHLYELIKRYALTANDMRIDIDANKTDSVTIDLLTTALEELDKDIWFMESHLE